MSRLIVVLLGLGLFACVPRLSTVYEPLDSYSVPEPSEYPNAYGVYLDWQSSVQVHPNALGSLTRQAQQRRVLAILNENLVSLLGRSGTWAPRGRARPASPFVFSARDHRRDA